ncbi:MAG: hypothetical protein WCF83_20885 [Pseudolabrys sp.]
MAICEGCGNQYDKSFQVIMSGKTHTFDSFECAIHALAPSCAHCGVKILGHGLEKEGTFFCCDHCAEAKGVQGLRDRIR